MEPWAPGRCRRVKGVVASGRRGDEGSFQARELFPRVQRGPQNLSGTLRR